MSKVVRARESENCPAGDLTGSKRKIYLARENFKCKDVVENTWYVTTLSSQVPETI